MINFAVGKFIKTIGIMRNKFKKGDNVKIRRDQTGGVWQVKEVKQRECDKGHPETRFIYLCEEVDSKHQQWIKEERLDEYVINSFGFSINGQDLYSLGNIFVTSHTNEIKVEDEPYEPKDNEFYWVEGNCYGYYIVGNGYMFIDNQSDTEPFARSGSDSYYGFFKKLSTRRPATPTEKDKLIKAVEKQYSKTYNEETKQWEDMAVEWTPQPFERVLVRDNEYSTTWNADFYSYMEGSAYYCVGSRWEEVIPYKGNEALLGTTDECKTKYKIK